jgi:hypothetical protein
MPRKDRAMSRAADMAREASETGETMRMKDMVMTRAAEMAKEASETHELVKEYRGRTGR